MPPNRLPGTYITVTCNESGPLSFSAIPSSHAVTPFSLELRFFLSLSRFSCCLRLQEYIRRQLEEEQRQLEILQQQLLQEQALLLVMRRQGSRVASFTQSFPLCCVAACICLCLLRLPPINLVPSGDRLKTY